MFRGMFDHNFKAGSWKPNKIHPVVIIYAIDSNEFHTYTHNYKIYLLQVFRSSMSCFIGTSMKTIQRDDSIIVFTWGFLRKHLLCFDLAYGAISHVQDCTFPNRYGV